MSLGGNSMAGLGAPDWRTRITRWTGDYWPHLLVGMLVVTGSLVVGKRKTRAGVTTGLWCRCKHYMWLGDERPEEDDLRIRCWECHPKRPCPACGKPGAEQALDTSQAPTYGLPAPVEVREWAGGKRGRA